MELTTILFYFFSLVTLTAASVMVFSRNIVHSAFALMFSLIGVAALYVLLYADFMAATQLLVYVGGILVLILFGVMLTNQGYTISFREGSVNLIPASLLSAVAAVILIYTFLQTNWAFTQPESRTETVHSLGMMLMGEYLLPFISAGVLLLIAIIGAILISTKLSAEAGNSSER